MKSKLPGLSTSITYSTDNRTHISRHASKSRAARRQPHTAPRHLRAQEKWQLREHCDENDTRKEATNFGRTREGGASSSLVSAFKWRLVGAGTGISKAGIIPILHGDCSLMPAAVRFNRPSPGQVRFFLSFFLERGYHPPGYCAIVSETWESESRATE